ncbi:MAG: zinc-ribbon domain-containing protein, partial [Clostridia bacterium]|nr:zinc-ribbon domain-containing protein [Clostridia bacterium]
MFCPNCGTQITENGAFCPNCGSAVQNETIDISSVLENEEKPEKVKKTKKKLRIVIACVLAFAIMVVGTIGGLKFFGNKSADIIGDVNYTALTEGFTDVLITDEKSAIEAVGSIADLLGINDAGKELKSKSTNQVGEDKYYSLQQYYNDIPVYGKNVIVSADKDGKAMALTSN